MNSQSNNLFCFPAPDVVFEDKLFCFTGEFDLGSRAYCKAIALSYGAKKTKSLTMKTDYLVIGSHDSAMWGHEHYGNKIEKAIKYRNKSKAIKIISEEHFTSFIDIDKVVEILKPKYKKKIRVDFDVKYTDLIVFDLETTGLSADNNEIIEIGAIKVINGSFETYTTLVKPTKKVSKQITKITGITNKMLLDAPSIEDIIDDFFDFLEDFPLVAHNASFDMRFLKRNLENHNLIFRENIITDTLSLARRKFPELENHKLSTLIKHLGIKVERSHRATDDALATLQIYNSLFSD